MLETGSLAPEFILPDQEGNLHSLSDLLKQGALILYFYPKDDTPGCTAEACAFRDQYEDFLDAGARVVGVSSDGGDSHLKFARKYKLPFLLLSDEDGSVAKKYGVKKTLGLLPGRETFVISKEGQIAYCFRSQFNAKAHVSKTIEVVSSLSSI